MIAYLRGILLESSIGQVTIDVNGVGYEVNVPISTLDKLGLEGNEVALFINTQVREDAITLFGFASKEERELFKILINVSGIGGKLANGILSSITIDSFVSAIKNGDVAILTKISGVGKKSAERLIVELKDKLNNFDTVNNFSRSSSTENSQVFEDTLLALTQLGFKRDMAIKAIEKIMKEQADNEITTEELLRLSLSHMQI